MKIITAGPSAPYKLIVAWQEWRFSAGISGYISSAGIIEFDKLTTENKRAFIVRYQACYRVAGVHQEFGNLGVR